MLIKDMTLRRLRNSFGSSEMFKSTAEILGEFRGIFYLILANQSSP